jgi:hypothetical protein
MVATVHNVRVPVVDVGTSSNHACASCLKVVTGEVRSLLLGQHNSNAIVAVGRLPIAIEGYRPLLHRGVL